MSTSCVVQFSWIRAFLGQVGPLSSSHVSQTVPEQFLWPCHVGCVCSVCRGVWADGLCQLA